jgi:hypothetical protein
MSAFAPGTIKFSERCAMLRHARSIHGIQLGWNSALLFFARHSRVLLAGIQRLCLGLGSIQGQGQKDTG